MGSLFYLLLYTNDKIDDNNNGDDNEYMWKWKKSKLHIFEKETELFDERNDDCHPIFR